MTCQDAVRSHERWAHLRFAIVGPLLASPPVPGELRAALAGLAARVWLHPLTGQPVRFGVSTIERWYYAAQKATDPVVILRRKPRKDIGQQQAISLELGEALRTKHAAHPSWSNQLHRDTLDAILQ